MKPRILFLAAALTLFALPVRAQPLPSNVAAEDSVHVAVRAYVWDIADVPKGGQDYVSGERYLEPADSWYMAGISTGSGYVRLLGGNPILYYRDPLHDLDGVHEETRYDYRDVLEFLPDDRGEYFFDCPAWSAFGAQCDIVQDVSTGEIRMLTDPIDGKNWARQMQKYRKTWLQGKLVIEGATRTDTLLMRDAEYPSRSDPPFSTYSNTDSGWPFAPASVITIWKGQDILLKAGEIVNIYILAPELYPLPYNDPTRLIAWVGKESGTAWLSWRLPRYYGFGERTPAAEQIEKEREGDIHYEYQVKYFGNPHPEWTFVHRKETVLGEFEKNNIFSPTGPGMGITTSYWYQRRDYLVTGLDPSREYRFCVRAVNAAGELAEDSEPACSGFDGAAPVIPVSAEPAELPGSVRLAQNYPNPFNPATSITYELASPGPVRLEVFDATGRSVAVLADGVQPAGRHSVRFDASGLPSGLYVYRLQAGGAALTRTMILIL